jgi:hypothetical protein
MRLPLPVRWLGERRAGALVAAGTGQDGDLAQA